MKLRANVKLTIMGFVPKVTNLRYLSTCHFYFSSKNALSLNLFLFLLIARAYPLIPRTKAHKIVCYLHKDRPNFLP